MRRTLLLALGLGLAACSNQPQASEDELEDFVPPTVRVRGDVVPDAQARFARFDKNADGFLAAGEFPRDGDRRVATLDGNNDGKVSRSEFVEAALNRFDHRDANADRQVTPQERDAARNSGG